jgi:hypothetical protein
MQKSLETFDSMPAMRAMNSHCTTYKVNIASEEHVTAVRGAGSLGMGKVRG